MLSLETHCSVPQQKRMAEIMKVQIHTHIIYVFFLSDPLSPRQSIFGDKIWVPAAHSDIFPSPESLKGWSFLLIVVIMIVIAIIP